MGCGYSYFITSKPGRPCVSIIKLDNENCLTVSVDSQVSHSSHRAMAYHFKIGNVLIRNVQIYVQTVEILKLKMFRLEMFRLESAQIGNKELGNAEIGRMEWPSLAIVSDAAMDICECNQVELVGTPHTG